MMFTGSNDMQQVNVAMVNNVQLYSVMRCIVLRSNVEVESGMIFIPADSFSCIQHKTDLRWIKVICRLYETFAVFT